MTIGEMHIAFKMWLDKSYGLELAAFENEEIDFWLNKAVREFVKTRYSGMNVKREGFEESQKRIDDLRTLVIEEDLSVTDGTNKPNSFIADLTSLIEEYWFTVGEEVTIEYNDIRSPSVASTKRQGVIEATANNYRALIDNPYSEHRLHYEEAKPIRLFLGDTVELITDGNYDVTEYHIRFIRKPVEVSITSDPIVHCDLPEHTHDEVVKMAVRMALENIEQPRYGSFAQEQSVME